MLSHIDPVNDHHVTATKRRASWRGNEAIRVRNTREMMGARRNVRAMKVQW
jgi:hypothetical protein